MRKGFTLIELIVVIAIIAVLAAIVAPNAFKAIEKGKISATIGDSKSIKTGAMAYYADTGTWVATCAASPCTSGFVTAPAPAVSGWDGPYLEKWPARANWGGTYVWKKDTDSTANVGSFDWDDAAGTTPDVRVVSVTSVPVSAAKKIDIQLDGVDNRTAGGVRYAAGATPTVYFLISHD